MTAAVRMLAYGHAADVMNEYTRSSDSSSMLSMKELCRTVVEEFEGEDFRAPTAADAERIVRVNTARGSPGMVGSIDSQYYEWQQLPIHLAGQCKGKEKNPMVVLEGVADGEGWIWSMFYGLPGSLNDLTVLDKSSTTGAILMGKFLPKMKSVVNGRERDHLYLLTDGIYPKQGIFVQMIANGGSTRKQKCFPGL